MQGLGEEMPLLRQFCRLAWLNLRSGSSAPSVQMMRWKYYLQANQTYLVANRGSDNACLGFPLFLPRRGPKERVINDLGCGYHRGL
jgi:hypothetical protein